MAMRVRAVSTLLGALLADGAIAASSVCATVEAPACDAVKQLYQDSTCCPTSTKEPPGDLLELSHVRHQLASDAECWDLLNQRWTQIVSEKDTGGMVTVMKVDLPHGCKQLAHVHCGLHEAFYKLNDNGHAIWVSQQEGQWKEVSPEAGDWSYAAMGIGHGYTNADVLGCNGTANVEGYTNTSFTSHFVIKMPGYEHETRARTVEEVNSNLDPNEKTCDMMTNPIQAGYSQDAQDAIAAYGATDPKFIPALVTLGNGSTYSPSKDDVKPLQYTPHTDVTVNLTPPNTFHTGYGNTRTSVRRLMSLDDWAVSDAGVSDAGTGGVAQMDEIAFSGNASTDANPARTPLDTDIVLLMVKGTAEIVSVKGTEKTSLPEYSGVVVKRASTDFFRVNCLSTDGCKMLDLRVSPGFATSYMHDAAYRVPWDTKIEGVTSDYVTDPWPPSKNTYQRCAAPNDVAVAPHYKDFTQTNRPTGTQAITVPFSCTMACVADATLTTTTHSTGAAFSDTRRTYCKGQFPGVTSSSKGCAKYLAGA